MFFFFLNQTKRFTEFGGTIVQRPVQDLAFSVARFIQKGGSYVNYYMVVILHDSTHDLNKNFLFLANSLFIVYLESTMEELILDALLEAHSLQPVMTMMPL